MNKKRNKYFFKEKAILRLKMEGNDISDAIYNQGYIELDEPIPHGYNAEWVLRSDIARRDDANVYQEVLDACKGKIWSRNQEFRVKNNKTKRWDYQLPELKKISKEKYEALSPSAKKFFYEATDTKKYWRYGYSDKEYRCTLSYEIVVLITKSFITHRREHDNVLYQMDAENDKLLFFVADGHPWTGNNGHNWWNRHQDRKLKLQAEREIVDVKKAYRNITKKTDLLDL